MGNVAKRPDGKYRARWRDLSGKEHAKHFTKKRDADAWLAIVEGDKLRGQYVDPTDRTTVAQYARRWAAARPHNPRTAKRVDSLIRTHIEGTSIGSRRLVQVLPSDAQAWVTERAQVLSPSTLRLLVSLVRSVYASAQHDRLVGSSPFAARLTMPEAHQERIIPLTVDQVHQLADAMPTRNRAMVLTQAGLGLRIGELLALRLVDVDFLRRTVRVETQIAPGERTRTAPKTSWSRRTVPLPAPVAEALAAHIEGFPPPADGTLFTTRFGKPYRHDYYGTRIFQAAVAAAGLPSSTTPHDLRHHYASILLHAGESVVAVAERLGHKNAKLVLSTYGHLMPDSEERTRKAVENAWRKGGADSARTSARVESRNRRSRRFVRR
ncbi:integrase [Micromonospora sp. A200]|uniref:tyrosine-type recombinase/integrase n=1 Tax=Micromonospora sp. A200 TaxID=2940568 RepID=UPI0024768D4D|nr:site-specific integrase [Micromonospora sp. A200]MDH6460894.1 integrase [Micromonospora sp. A200]